MGLIIILGLLIWGWAEMSAFIYIGSGVGGLLTLLGVFITAIFGIALLKHQGLSVIRRIQADFVKGRAPVTSIADSISMVVGGTLMLIPGYVTDAIGLLLFLPGIRTLAGVSLMEWNARNKRFTRFTNFGFSGPFENAASSNPVSGTAGHQHNPFTKQKHKTRDDDDIIEGEFEERPDQDHQITDKKGNKP
ncbi:FxsA family protein [Candidatus Puniceispirillum sp.]|nr:FxsA family protein [Alphaproteobacteria bacterium]MDC1293708.1 FxsA family protein [Candidatus Puniceispirillum sp.]